MISSDCARRGSAMGASLGAMLLVAACSSQPSIGPNTASGVPSHIDGGAGQVLRFCEKLHDAGNLTTAAAMCERAHHLDPAAPEPLLELAGILAEMGEADLAMEAYRRLLRTAPENAEGHYGLGRAYLDRGQHDLALSEFQAALRGNPKDPRLYNAVGVASGLLGAHAEAQRAFRHGLLVAPDDTSLRNNLGLSLVQSGRYEEGLSHLETLGKDPRIEQASRENLAMAQGLAAAARAESMLAQARAEAEAQAEAEAAALAEAGAQSARAATDTMPAPADAARPAIPVSYPQSAWPVDGPGEDGMTPIGTLASQGAATPTAQIAATPAPAPTARPVLRPAPPEAADPAPVAAPTSLTRAMSAPVPARAAKGPTRAGDSPFSRPSHPINTRPSPGRPQGRQTARADFDGASDSHDATAAPEPSGPGGAGPAGAIAWTPPGEEVDPAPSRPVAVPPRLAGRATELPGGPHYAVQFASYTSAARAWRGWDSLQGVARDLLIDVEPTVRSADLGVASGVVYRLRSAPTPKTTAESLCAALADKGVECLVVKAEPKTAENDAEQQPATL